MTEQELTEAGAVLVRRLKVDPSLIALETDIEDRAGRLYSSRHRQQVKRVMRVTHFMG